jgi:hypothetical protein
MSTWTIDLATIYQRRSTLETASQERALSMRSRPKRGLNRPETAIDQKIFTLDPATG